MKKQGSTSDQRSDVRSDVLRSLTIPRLIALETMSQDLVRRYQPTVAAQSHVWVNAVNRLPIVGLRSQRERYRGRIVVPQYNKEPFRLSDPLKTIYGTKSICQKRSERREILFKLGIAGKGQRRSPGAGGRYRRREESMMSCRKVRR